MSITRRILEGAQSSLSRLTSLVIVDDEPLSHVEGPALQAELAARKAARAKAGAVTNPLAKLATSDPAARAARDKAARDRASRVHRERDEREAKQRQAADEAFRKMKDQASRPGATWTSSSSSSSPSGSSSSSSGTSSSARSSGNARPPRPGSTAANLAEWYRVLDLEAGADMAQIKSAYRRAMRKYHPDMHAGNPQKQKAATELSMRVTSAYNGLVTHFERK